MLKEQVESWDCPEILVGCSGNFTVERILQESGRFGIHGNDVTIYSCVLGNFLAGQGYPLSVKPEWKSDWGWLAPYLDTPEKTVATVLLSTRMFEGLGRENPYYSRMRHAYRAQWEHLHSTLVNKVTGFTLKLQSFFAGDVRDALEMCPKERGVICYPPFYAGDYKAMYANLANVFDWTEPCYRELDESGIAQLLAEIATHRYWMFGVPTKQEKYGEFLRGVTQTTNRAKPVYVYSCGGHSRYTGPRQELAAPMVPVLGAAEMLDTGAMRLAILTQEQFQHCRSMYMNPHIRPGQATVGVGVMVNDRLVGVYALSEAPSMASNEGTGKILTPTTYMLSDFPVAPTCYKRLAKLVLYAALSKEGKLLAERYAHRRVRGLTTTAFSRNPVSMKYRGVMEILNRKEIVDEDGVKKFQMNYGATMGQWSLSEGLALWRKKHGQILGENGMAEA